MVSGRPRKELVVISIKPIVGAERGKLGGGGSRKMLLDAGNRMVEIGVITLAAVDAQDRLKEAIWTTSFEEQLHQAPFGLG